jgi:nitrogen regulatory protein PII
MDNITELIDIAESGSKTQPLDLELICFIANRGIGSKIIKTAKKEGVSGGTVMYGKGTAPNMVSNFLGGLELEKEVILMAGEREVVKKALDKMTEKYYLSEPNTGIAFTLELCGIVGTSSCKCQEINDKKGVTETMYNLIMTIVDRGKAEEVVDAAIEGGAPGGTIINGRGSGIHETQKVFSMFIEPEKEIVMIVSPRENTEKIVDGIRHSLKMDEPGNGVVFVQSINQVYGLYEEEKNERLEPNE